MKLDSIRILGMHKVKDVTYDLSSGFKYFYGKNGAGKSTVLQAIQLALLGYIPGTDKNKAAIFQHSNGPIISVQITIDDNGIKTVITRTWKKKGSSVETSAKIQPDRDLDEYLENILKGIELPVFNFNEFSAMSANKLKDWFINFLPPSSDVIDWEKKLKTEIVEFGEILDSEILTETLSYINTLPDPNSVEAVRSLNAYLNFIIII